MCAGNEGEVRSQPRRSGDRLSGEEKERRARREERTTNAIVGGREGRRIERESVGQALGGRRPSLLRARANCYWVDRQVVGRDFVCLSIELAS